MNLQQLRYLVATADAGTMTRAAAELHVAQPGLSRAVRALEAEIGITVFEREGRGLRVTGQGSEVVALARQVLGDVQLIASLNESTVLHVSAVTGQSHELASPAVARYMAGGGERVALDVVDTSDDVADAVRDGRSHAGVVDLPAPSDLQVVSLGWQEVVLLHPPGWALDDPLDIAGLSGLDLLSPESDDGRYDRMVRYLRAAGIEPRITARSNDRSLLVQLVQQGVGAWFSYGRRAREAVAGGAGMVHLRPRPLREIGVVHLGPLRGATADFVDALRAEAADVLISPDDEPVGDTAWIDGADLRAAVPPMPRGTTSRRPTGVS